MPHNNLARVFLFPPRFSPLQAILRQPVLANVIGHEVERGNCNAAVVIESASREAIPARTWVRKV